MFDEFNVQVAKMAQSVFQAVDSQWDDSAADTFSDRFKLALAEAHTELGADEAAALAIQVAREQCGASGAS